MNTIISFICLSYLIFLIYKICMYFKIYEDTPCKNKVIYIPISTNMETEMKMKYEI